IQLPSLRHYYSKKQKEPSVFVMIEENGRQIRRHTLNVTLICCPTKIAGRSKILLQATVAETLGRKHSITSNLGN
uniref:Ovule protein n=1 Tax=Loa loa TaxID=7209 RepID=A0A1I7VD28_LOALO